MAVRMCAFRLRNPWICLFADGHRGDDFAILEIRDDHDLVADAEQALVFQVDG